LLGPIFNREFLTVPRREHHYGLRVAFLGTLWVLSVTAWLATLGWQQTATLGETARLGPLLFRILTYVQLALFLFFSALSAASAIALEKDRRTFLLLLMTDLRDYEIVLGKLFGSLLPILLLLAATVPVWMLLLLLGGIAPAQVVQALLIVGAASLTAGSLGGLLALWRERTFQSLALTVLCLVLYLCVVRALTVLPELAAGVSAETVQTAQMWLEPFLALESVQQPLSVAGARLAPAYGFALAMLGLAALLNGVALLRLRVWNPSGEPIMQRETPLDAEAEEKDRAAAHAAPGTVRRVGPNPILWREIATRAYGRRPLLVKLAYAVVLFFICYYALDPLVRGGERAAFAAAYGLVPVGVLSLLLVSAQAATAITTERDVGALDLLLVTDLTPGEFIFGKLGGISYNTKEFLLPPLLLAAVYALYGCLASPPRSHPEYLGPMNALSLVCVLGCMLVLLAFAVMLGIHVALRTPNSRLAVTHTLGTIFFLSVGTLVTIWLITVNGRFEYQWGSFVFFIVAGIGGLWWVLNGDRPSRALTLSSWACPLGVFYTVATLLVGRPGTQESADPLVPTVVVMGTFGFAVAAMLVPLLSEFDVALGRTSGGAD
jgi:ABC-type transport system involved in multi-copper enzyme maturation permease subunit